LIRKAVIPVAGLGTRLLSATKEQPKEMLPVFSKSANGKICLKPLVQLVFEQLFEVGIREFCFIVGRGKRAMEDHFTPDYGYVERLNNVGKNNQAYDLTCFYKKLEESTIIWINQPEPKGFGHAVLLSQSLIGYEEFLVHAGDTYIISKGNDHLTRLIGYSKKIKDDATLVAKEVPNPQQYGIIEGQQEGKDFRVSRVVEKPEKPTTNLAIMPIYIFTHILFRALETTSLGKGGELQLTDGIQKLIDWGLNVHAIELNSDEIWLDIGTPETYWEAQSLSYKKAIE